jgi:hypothetical protein
MIRTFFVEVTRVDTYKVQLDDEIINKEWMGNFEKYFWKLEDGLESIASALAKMQAKWGSSLVFMEGFGNVTRNRPLPFGPEDFDVDGKLLPESERRQASKGINIIIVGEDDDIETEVTEIKEKKGGATQ